MLCGTRISNTSMESKIPKKLISLHNMMQNKECNSHYTKQGVVIILIMVAVVSVIIEEKFSL